jgi:8-oxo-dGTP diphosphatase
MEHAPSSCFYRVAVKAFILDETRTKFLITQEDNGKWGIPGGGLEWGTAPREELARELQEEMGLRTTWIAQNPSYVLTLNSAIRGTQETLWRLHMFYETKIESYEFTPSKECVAFKFVTKEEAMKLVPQTGIVEKIGVLFDPAQHTDNHSDL